MKSLKTLKTLLILTLLSGFTTFGQTFPGGGGAIPDNSTTTTCFLVNVTGVGSIDGSYGLEEVCINISHSWNSDLDIYLEAPDGTIVPLTSDNGGSSNNYSTTCFTMTAGTNVTAGTGPFNGNYVPEGDLGLVNNGQNANGTWSLCINDDAFGDVGTLNSWNLTFGNNPATPPTPPTNDDPCNATPLATQVNCSYSTYDVYGATSTSGVTAPGCGNYAGGDIWFTATVPTSGNIQVDTDEGTMTNGDIAMYTGTCSSLTLLDCDDLQSDNGSMGLITATGLTPGQTVYIRIWSNGNLDPGTFGICVIDPPTPPNCGGNPPASNTCGTAPNICDINGICGSTSSSYTANYWSQLNTAFCGSIENNSFITFVSDGNDLNLNVFIQNCAGGDLDAVQFMIFENSGCSGNITEIECQSPMYQGDSPVNFSATGLTAGGTYYLMIDGYAGDVCDYSIATTSGVEIPVDAGPDVSICAGESVTLNALYGDGTNYTWNNGAGSGASVTVSPTTTTTYTVQSPNANTFCGGPSTTDQVTVTVNTGGDLDVSASSALSGSVGPNAGNVSVDICAGGSASLDVSGATGGPTAYTWTPATGLSCTNCDSPSASPAATTTYTVTAASNAGCDLVATVTVNVTPAPTVAVTGGTICEGDNMTLTASGMSTYSWSPATGLSGTSGASVTASPTTTTTYTVTGSTAGCPNDTETATVTVTPLPNPNFSITGSQCLATNSLTLTNTGTAGTYSWSMPSGTPTTATGSPTTVSYGSAGTYNITLTTTTGSCSDDITIPVTINPNPTVTVTPADVSCNGDCDGSITAVGAGTSGYSYNWGGAGTGGTLNSQCAGAYNVTVTDINGCTVTGSGTINEPPLLTASATEGTIACNGGTTTVTVTASGGTTPYSGDGTFTVSAGAYSYTVTDAEGCTVTVTGNITEPPLLTASATEGTITCNGGTTTVDVSASGGTPGYTGDGTFTVSAGAYSYTVDDAEGCSVTVTGTITEPTAITPSIVNQTNVTCNGALTGSVTIGATGGSGTYTYNIGGGPQGSGAFTGLAAGSYTVTVADATDASCTETINITITEPAALTATIAPVALSCNGDADGQATVTAGGGSGSYTYTWDNTTFDNTATTSANLSAGTYNVTVADAAAPTCTITASVTVTEPAVISLTESSTPANCGASDGTATIVASGGSGTFTDYDWTPAPGGGQGTAAATGLAAGSYTVVVTDDNGCTNTITTVVSNNLAPTISEVMGSHVDVDCNGASTGEAEVSASGGVGTLTYAWTPSGGTGTTATGLAANTYTVTVTDANNCSDAVTITITEPTVLNAVASVTSNTTCNGDTDGEATVNVSGGTTGYTYQWFTSGGTPVAGATGASATGLAAGDYYVEVTDGNTCTIASNTITITEPTPVTASGTETPLDCNSDNSGSIDLTPSGGDASYSFDWTGPNGFTSNVEDPSGLEAGIYNVTVTDGAGCTGTASVTVNEPALLTVSATGNDAHCGQSDGDVSATGAGGTPTVTYEWFSDAGLSSSLGTGANLGTLAAGTYYIEVTDGNGCTESTSVTIGDLAGPTASATVNADATGPGICNGDATGAGTGGTGTLTYSWDNGNNNANATDLCAGSNCVTVTDDFGCTDVACVTINEPTGVTVVITPTDLLCNGVCIGQADVTASGGVGGYTYAWDHGPTAEDLTGLCAGTYNVTVTDANGNSGTGSVTITEPAAITFTSTTSSDALCNGACDGEVDAAATGGTGTLSYEWFDNTPGSVGTTANLTGLCAGTYDLVVTDDNSCTITTTATVNEPTAITLTPSNVSSNCGQSDGEVSVVAAGGTAPTGYTYLWEDATTATVGTTATVSGQLAGTYTVTVTDGNGCSETTTATISDAGGATLTETHINANCNGSFDGSIDITTVGGTGPFTYSWAGPNGYTSSFQDINLLEAGAYDVTVTDNVGCIATLSVTINEPAVLAITPTSLDATCFASSTGELDVTSTGGTGAATYVWFDDALLSNSIGTGSSLTNMPAGTYYVEATDANSCTVDGTITIGQPDDMVITTTATDANCGLSDGVVAVSGTTGESGSYVSEVWVDALNNPVADINAVPSGSYTVTVTDDQGCTGTAVQGVSDLVGPSLNVIAAASASCAGYCDGTALIEAVGGTPTYVYTWNPVPGTGQGTPSVTGLCAGDYNVSVSDDNGCTDNIIVTILEPAPLVATIAGNTDATINGAADGTATATAAGGTPGYTYEWYSSCPPGTALGQTAAGATGLLAGDYSVIVEDSKGCLDTVCTTISEPTTLTIVEVITDVNCFGGNDGEITVTVSGGVPGYTYEWFEANGTSTGQTGITASGLTAGDYYIVVEDQNGAIQQSSDFTVTEPTQLTLTTAVTSDYNGADISCFGGCDGTASVTASGGISPYSYSWDAAAGSQTTAAITGLCDGTYTVTVLDDHNCPSTETVTLVEPTQVTNIASQTDASCFGVCDGEAVTSVSGGTGAYSYQWNDPGLSTTSSISGLCAGTFDVTVTDANGCLINDSYSITEPTELVLGGSMNGSNCNQNDGDATVTIITGDAPFTYQWDANAGSQTTANATSLFAGSYNVVVTDGNGCTNDTTISVQDLGAPTVTILTQTDVSCNGGNDGFAQIQVTDGTPPYNYTWEDCGGTSIGQTTASALNLTAGCYNGSMVDAVGCQGTVSVTIDEPTALNAAITASSDVTCFGYTDGTATVTAGGGTAPYTYLWNDGSNQTTATATGLAPGTYQVTVTDNNSCTNTATVTIGEPDEIQLSTSVVDAFCATGTGSAAVTITSAGVSPFTYNWTPTSQATDVATGLTPGTYDVTVTDSDGCIQTAQATVGDIPPGTATIGTITDVLCNSGSDGTIDVSMSGTGTAPYTYQWFNATTGTAITGQTSAQATGLPAGDYYVEVTDDNGCFSTSNTGTINEPTQLQITDASTDALCNGSSDGTSEALASGGTQPYSYSWNDALNQTTITANGLNAGTYTVTVTDNNNCVETHDITINEPTQITIDSTVTNANCGQPDGQACVIPTGGTGTYTYLWPDNSTNSCATNLLAGTYIVTVEDQNACQEQISVEVSDLGGPIADITGFTMVSCNSFTDGQATVDMTSGNGTSFTVQWDANAGSQTTPTASNLGAGTYAVTITDDLGCNASTSVVITEPDVLAYNINTQDASCFSYCDGEAAINVIGGTAPYNYDWLDNANNTIGATNSINALCANTYGINVVDANGCSFSDNLTILEPVEVTGNIVGQNISCFNACDGEATATGDFGFAPFSFQWDAAAGSQTGGTAQNLCPGTYEVTITDNNGCLGTESVTLTEPTLLTSSISQSGNISCNGFCDGFAQGSAAGGTAPYQYSWSNNGGGAALANNLCAGTYTLTVTDANSCITTSNVTLTQPQALAASGASVDLSCFESCDGEGSVSVSGGVAPYQYQWDNSSFATTPSFTNECAGTYTVNVTDDNGCQLSETIVIGQPTDISISANITNSNCGQDNGQICSNVNGGTSPYSYQWNDPNTQTGACALSLFAGCYTFTVTDGNACIKDTLLCINDIAGPTVTALNVVDVTCFGAGNGSVEFSASGGTGALTNEIVDGLGNTVVSGAIDAFNLDGDCYTLISTDAAGCVATDVLCVNEPTQLNAAVIQSTDALCALACNGTALAASNGGTAPYAYSWNGGLTPSQNSNSGLCAGNYTVTVTDDNNCTTQANIQIDEPDPLAISEVITDVSCFGGGDGNIDITVTGGTPFYLYDWLPNGSTSEDMNMVIADTYTVTITDANGCNEIGIYTVDEPTQLVPSFVSFNSPTCEQCNGTAVVSATGGTGAYSYAWSSGNAQTSTSNGGMCPGLQEVTVTDANGCAMTISQSMVNQASPQIDSILFDAPSCNGLTNGNATVYPSGIFDPNQMTYLWDAGTNNQQTQTAVALGDGIYCVTVTDPNGCTASSCVDIIEPTPLNAVPDGSTTICYGQDTQIWASGQGGTAPYTIQWTTAGLTGQGPILVEPTVSTDYCFRVQDDNGCLSPLECVSIIVREPLALDVTPSTSICDGGSFDINALATGGVPADYVFAWQDEFNSAITPTTVNDLSTITVSPATPTWYYVTLSDGCSIDAIDSAQISINPLPVAFLSAVDSSGCEPLSTQFIANSDIGVTYEFDIDCDGVYESSSSSTSFNYTFDLAGTYDVCLNVISVDGCSTLVSNPDFIEVYPVPTADFTPDPAETTIMTPEITFIDNSTGGSNYDWDFGDGYLMTGHPLTVYNGEENTSGVITLPTHTFLDTGYYEVMLTVTSVDGCTSVHTETIFIEGDYAFYTPNAFSPNGDGDNDTFRPIGIGIDEDNYEFYIFNRWGQLIFEGYDPYDEWDGTYMNVMSQTDVYVWMVKTRDNNGAVKEYQGHVTLVK